LRRNYLYTVYTRAKKYKKTFSLSVQDRLWPRPYMEIKTALAFLLDTFLFGIMSTYATVTVHVDLFYATQFLTKTARTKIKMIAL